MNEIGDAIRQVRAALGGISQERFARKIGTTTRTVARWEASKSLSAPILSRLHFIALAAQARESADFFEENVKSLLDMASHDGAIALAIESERERCAKIAESQGADRVALEIRTGE